ncbi:MAG: aldehyde ferredoxin oxidoreductase C-terminal domain-containing protein, partial [Chloroflexota bacterium]
CGATISWAFECFEQGVLTAEDTGGLVLSYGDAGAMVALLEKILNRDGIGDVLAEGSAKAADHLGKGHEYLLTVKGQELPAHMPHVKRSLVVVYATNPFGADHQSSEHDPLYHPKPYEGSPEAPGYKVFLNQIGLDRPQPTKVLNEEKIEYALKTQYNYSAMDTLGLCQFVYGPAWQLYGPQDQADLLAAATGWPVTVADVQLLGQRRLNLMRALNAREGLARDKDTLPKKLFTKPLSGGRSDGIVLDQVELDAGLEMYYRQAGWSKETGVPTRQTLEDLGLSWAADDLGL